MTDAARITVAGSFGFGNAGDEAVPIALRDLASAAGVDLTVDVLTRFDRVDDPSVITMGPSAAPRREALCDQPIVFCGGGVVEPRDHCVLLRCESVLDSVQHHQRVLYAANVESGRTYGWRMTRRLRRVLEKLDTLTVRDVRSAEALAKIAPGREIDVVGDVVLGLAAAARKADHGARNYIAVSLAPRWSDDEAWLAWISSELAALAIARNASLTFVPMSIAHDDDRPVMRTIAARLTGVQTEIIEDIASPGDIANVFRHAQLTVGMRLHACVMSAAMGTPFVGIAYHPKVKAFAETVGCGRSCLPVDLPAAQSRDVYGYRFEELMMNVSLNDAASQATEAQVNGELFRQRLTRVLIGVVNSDASYARGTA